MKLVQTLGLKSVAFRDLFVVCSFFFFIKTTALVNFKFKNGGTGNKLKDERDVLSYSMTTQHLFLTCKK